LVCRIDTIAVLGLEGNGAALSLDRPNILVMKAGHHAPVTRNIGLEEHHMSIGNGYPDQEDKGEKKWL
jgi:hypothetical protein